MPKLPDAIDKPDYYEELKRNISWDCNSCPVGGGGMYLESNLIEDIASSYQHLQKNPSHKMVFTLEYDPDPHLVDGAGNQLPWREESVDA